MADGDLLMQKDRKLFRRNMMMSMSLVKEWLPYVRMGNGDIFMKVGKWLLKHALIAQKTFMVELRKSFPMMEKLSSLINVERW